METTTTASTISRPVKAKLAHGERCHIGVVKESVAKMKAGFESKKTSTFRFQFCLPRQ
jgi:hypothetical protein